MGTLTGKIALVAGATRGAGRGIARMLGEAGATVYCTGRSARGAERRAPEGGGPFDTSRRPETIDETAELVTAAGGRGIAVRVDHSDEEQVAALFARVRAEAGGLDILVNDVWGGDALTEWGRPFWEQDVQQGLRLLRQAVDTHIVTARHGLPLLIERGAGLHVEITDGVEERYRGSFYYDLVKSTVNRIAFALAEELRPHGVAAVAVTPGFLRSEAMLEHFGVSEANWRDGAAKDPHFIASETPCFVGRAVAALAADPQVLQKSGGGYSSWDLSDEYGFTDIDGARPHWGRYYAEQLAGKA